MTIASKGRGLLLLCAALLAASAPAQTIVSRIDLSSAFGARPGWRFLAFQGPETINPSDGNRVPGAIRLCISQDGGRTCRPDLRHLLSQAGEADDFSEPHFLNDTRIVRPRRGQALLLIQAASFQSANGNERVATAAFTYDRARNMFVLAYEYLVGRNNNEEIRYIAGGPLRGAIASAEPTGDAPFGFWIVVNRLAPSGQYRQVLRYRSATRYNDGNPLAVIDSEMPNIQQRLGLWRPGQPLPLPAGGCRRPRLIDHELWCRPGDSAAGVIAAPGRNPQNARSGAAR
jgi:hypothetical protein